MTIETSQEALSSPDHVVGEETIQEALEGILAATTAREASEHQLEYEQIAKLFLDAHSDRVEALQQEKRGLVLEALVDNPAEAFRGEFLQLERLYAARTVANTTHAYLGGQINEFCTQNHEKQRCDYLFRHAVSASGRESLEVSKVYDIFGLPRLVTVSLRDDELHVVERAYKRGNYYDVELEGERQEQILAQLFYDTIRASAMQIERSADEREDNDARAVQYLLAVRKNEYQQF